jgi:antitoxin CptB
MDARIPSQIPTRVYWHCRRGMAELDEMLQGFLEKDYLRMNTQERIIFEQLLSSSDTLLLEYLMGRTVPSDPTEKNVIEKIRQSTRSQT